MEAHEVREFDFTVWEFINAAACVNNVREYSVGEHAILYPLSHKLRMTDAEREATGFQERRDGDEVGYQWRVDAPLIRRKLRGEAVTLLIALVMHPPRPLFTIADGDLRRALLEKLGATAEQLNELFGSDE
ncbi:MAG: hypothetical protein WC683_07970 [bacterium]